MSRNVRPNRRREKAVRKLDGEGWKSLWVSIVKIALTCAVAVGIPYGAYAYYQSLADEGYFAPTHVTVVGNVRASDDEILEASGLRQDGANLFEMNVRTVEESIETLAWVKAARVDVDLPDSVRIGIVEHEPLGIVNDGALRIVDHDAQFIKLLSEDDALMSPLVSVDQPLASRERMVVIAFEIAALARRMGYAHNVEEIRYDAGTGYTLFTADTEIRLGYEAFELRMGRLLDVDAELERRQVAADYILLDSEDISRVVVKPKILAQAVEAKASEAKGEADGRLEGRANNEEGALDKARAGGVQGREKAPTAHVKQGEGNPAEKSSAADKSSLDDDAALAPIFLEDEG